MRLLLRQLWLLVAGSSSGTCLLKHRLKNSGREQPKALPIWCRLYVSGTTETAPPKQTLRLPAVAADEEAEAAEADADDMEDIEEAGGPAAAAAASSVSTDADAAAGVASMQSSVCGCCCCCCCCLVLRLGSTVSSS